MKDITFEPICIILYPEIIPESEREEISKYD